LNGWSLVSAWSLTWPVTNTWRTITLDFTSIANGNINYTIWANDWIANSNILSWSFVKNVYTPPTPPSYSWGGGWGWYASSNAPKLSTNSWTSIAESIDKSQRFEVSYPAWIRTLTNTYNQTFDDASIMPDGTYRYMYQTLTWFIQEVPFNSSVNVKITDKNLNQNSEVYIKTVETDEWILLTNYKLDGNTLSFNTDKWFVLRIVNKWEEWK
jgi:hypothetical protein